MFVNNPRAIERDNQNALRKFPFADAASGTNGTCVIVSGAIVDAQLYIPGRAPDRVWLSEIDTDGKLHFSDTKGEFACTTAAATSNTAVPVTFTGDGGPLPGGMIVFGDSTSVATLVSYGGQKFKVAHTELAAATLSWPGLPGVLGFRLDDGNIVYGDVRIVGENGCDVATYVEGDVNCLRISAIGKAIDVVDTTGFITTIRAHSDNTSFVVSQEAAPKATIDITATGVWATMDGDAVADQDETCEAVKKARGTTIAKSAAIGAACLLCAEATTPANVTIRLFGDPSATKVVETITPVQGTILEKLTLDAGMPDASTQPGKRFAGYFDADGVLYFRYDGTPVRKAPMGVDALDLYAHWVAIESTAEVSLSAYPNYGTLHLRAPSTVDYNNPITITGEDNVVPSVHEVPDDILKVGGADALAEIVMHPTVPDGIVKIGIRGLNKVYAV